MPYKVLTIRCLAILLILSLCACFTACQKTNAAGQPTLGTPAADTFDNDDLFAIMDEAGDLLLRGSYTIEDPSEFVEYFFKCNAKTLGDCLESKGNTISIQYSSKHENIQTKLQYGIFLHLICSRYPDAVCEADFSYTAARNLPYLAYVFFYPGYKEAGYKTPLDACMDIYKALENSKDNAFYIHMGDFFVIREGRLDKGVVIYNHNG